MGDLLRPLPHRDRQFVTELAALALGPAPIVAALASQPGPAAVFLPAWAAALAWGLTITARWMADIRRRAEFPRSSVVPSTPDPKGRP